MTELYAHLEFCNNLGLVRDCESKYENHLLVFNYFFVHKIKNRL